MSTFDDKSAKMFSDQEPVVIMSKLDTGIVVDSNPRLHPITNGNSVFVYEDHLSIKDVHEVMDLLRETDSQSFRDEHGRHIICKFWVKNGKRMANFRFIDRSTDLYYIHVCDGNITEYYTGDRKKKFYKKESA